MVKKSIYAVLNTKKYSFSFLLVFILTSIPSLLFGQKNYSNHAELRILPAEHFSGTIQQASCFSDSGENGCYIVQLKTPKGITVSYSKRMLTEIPRSVKSLTNIMSMRYSSEENNEPQMLYSVVIPGSGAILEIKDEEHSEINLSHMFPPDKSGQILYFQILKTSAGSIENGLTSRPEIDDPNGIIPDRRIRKTGQRVQSDETITYTDQNKVNEANTGRLRLWTDTNAEILINNESLGTGNLDLNLEPGMYRVEMIHRLGKKEFDVEVKANESVQHSVSFLPNRSTAIQLSIFFPGGGQIYTKQNHGYFFLLASLGSAAFTIYHFKEYRSFNSEYQNGLDNYQLANSLESASRYRRDIENSYQSLLSARKRALTGLGIFGAFYLIQLMDISFSEPAFGYRSRSGRKFSAGITNTGLSLNFRF